MTTAEPRTLTPKDVERFFSDAERRKIALEHLEYKLEAAASPKGGAMDRPVVGGGDHGDPTARAAEQRIRASAELAEAEADYRDHIEHCRRLCRGVGIAMGYDVRMILEEHYLGTPPDYERKTWKEVAASMGMAQATVYRKRDAAFEWISFVGYARAEEGQGFAESTWYTR